MWLPQLQRITRFIVWVLIIASLVVGSFWAVTNFMALNYTPENITQRFVTLIENPTQTITEAEKKELQDITQNGFFSQWGSENNIKTLRRISQQKPITTAAPQYTGVNSKYATVEITFENDFKNPEAKKAKIYLEKYGLWYAGGAKWRIYQVDMPREDNLLDDIRRQTEDTGNAVQDGAQDALDSIRDLFGS